MNLDALKKANILVLGDIILDKYLEGSVSRVSPEAPVPVLKPESEEIRLGGAANVASNISALGSKVYLQGIVGKDETSKQLKALLESCKIKNSLIKSSKPTISKLRLLASKQQLIRLDIEEQFSLIDWNLLKKSFNKLIANTSATVLILSDYEKGTLQDIPYLIGQARKNNLRVLVDPKGSNFMKYKGASVITPNYSEFVSEVGGVSSESDLTSKGKNLLVKLNLDALLITRGSEGMTLIERDNKKIIRSDFPTQAKEVFDVSGAGDTVIAALAVGLASNLELNSSVKLANFAAGIVVGKSGTAVPKKSEMEQFFTDDIDNLTKQSLKRLCDFSKQESKRIVFTNGCFDVLHAGHVSYLESAKKMGDKLIVAINSDSSVKKLKGTDRPINSLAERKVLLEALSCVDWVIDFSEETPLKLIEYLKPDVLVKGADYKIQDIVGSKFVLKSGGEVKTIKFVKGISSTQKINKIRNLIT